MNLTQEKCVPCRGDTMPLADQDIRILMPQIPDWTLKDKAIERTFQFKDFKEAIKFINRVADVAEEENHHPDICVYYSRVHIELSTHKINGLSKNDFILAAKIDELV